MLTSLVPGKREKGYYGNGPGMAESGYGQQQGVHPGYPNGPDGYGGGNPGGYAGNGGVSQPPPAYRNASG